VLFYRLLLTLAAPWFAWRLWRDGDAAARQRLGGESGGARRGAVLWLHGASNGELTAARPLIDALLARDPRLTLLVTCNTITGHDMVYGWGIDQVEPRLAPLDYRLVLQRFIGDWQPEALILIENELWPNRMAMMTARDRPVVVLSARMSARSAAVWQKLPGLARRVMGAIAFLSAQDNASEARFRDLGLAPDRIGETLNLKHDIAQSSFDAAEMARLAPLLPRDRTVLAASTHEGEEAGLLRGFRIALAKQPGLRLILAPRHPRRSEEIAALIAKEGLDFATRSKGETPKPDTPVYLADTMGEMPLWYELAGTAFVGGSLAPKGGHTPFEPAAHGCALLHGPHLENFAEVYTALQQAGASRLVTGTDSFAEALATLDASIQAKMADRARTVIARMRQGAGLAPILDKLADLTGDADLRGR